MGRSKEFSINLDNNKETYYAGEQLSGNVVLHLHEPTSMLRLILHVEGKAICKTGSSCTEIAHKNNITLFGSMPGSISLNNEHPAGKQAYRFNFLLPVELPSSVKEGNSGMIKYNLIAKVVFKGFLSSDWKVKRDFNVKQILDANIPDYDLQHVYTGKKIASLFQNQKKLEREDLLVSLRRGVYCPGEEMDLHIQYKYVECRKLGLVKCRLNKYAHFNKKENKTIYKKTTVEENDIKKSDEKIYQRIISIKIPDGLTPTNTLTNAVVINYVLHVKIDGYKEIKLPVVMGTIPYDETRAQEQLNNLDASGQPIPPSENHHLQAPSAPPSAPSPDHLQASASSTGNSNNMYPSVYENSAGEIQCEFFHPPPYIPEDEFDLPPSYDDVIEETTSNLQLVVAQ